MIGKAVLPITDYLLNDIGTIDELDPINNGVLIIDGMDLSDKWFGPNSQTPLKRNFKITADK